MQKYWFAARTRDKQEFAIRKHLERLKAEEGMDIEHFLPTRMVVVQQKYRRKRKEVPVIRNLVFVHATKEDACSIPNRYSVPLFYMKDLSTHAMLVVPDKQMEDFIFVMDLDPEGMRISSEPLTRGTRVRVIKGDLTGVEGEISTEAGKTFVVIRVHNLLSASVKVPKGYLEKI